MTSVNRQVVGHIDELEVGEMRMATVGERAIAVIRTSKGVYALDNACPHQGYGLTTGSLDLDDDPHGAAPDSTTSDSIASDGTTSDGAVVTCQWHNWKFRVADGVCVMGEEDVPCHRVDIDTEGQVAVTLVEPTNEEARARLWPSLRSGVLKDYRGQIARDAIRLMINEAAPADIMWEGVAIDAPRNDYGPGHAMAMAADCLHLAELWNGDDRALPLVQGLAGIAETSRDRPARALPAPDSTLDLIASIEAEQVESSMAATLGLIEDGADRATVRHQFIEAVSRHHLDYGHGAIYTQKAFELLERVGWERAPELLPHLAVGIATGTREDVLPYMTKAMRQLEHIDLDSLADAGSTRADGWSPDELALQLYEATTPPIELAADAIVRGGGVEGLLDAVSLAVSHRLLTHDVSRESGIHPTSFGWLDITHGLTYARAARWAWQHDPGPHTARLALFTAWLAFDTGRAQRQAATTQRQAATTQRQAATTQRQAATTQRQAATTPRQAVELIGEAEQLPVVAEALDPATDLDAYADRLARAAIDDRGGSFIVVAHLIKTTQAAREEAATIGSPLPLAATARFVHSPRRERFTASTVAESLSFVTTGRPPRR
ncbi:MAG: Rieske (2Fe-2S) protein [Acidimicrobiales bacterium]